MKKIIGVLVIILLISFFIYFINENINGKFPDYVLVFFGVIPLILVGGLFYLFFKERRD